MNNSFIHDIVAEHQDVETPQSWIYWSSIFCISSVAANAYTVRSLKGKVTYYPNVYIMLLGESGLGKGYPVNLAKRFIQETNCTRVIAGRSSIQAIIKEGSLTKSRPNQAPILDSRMAIINGELSSAMIGDPQALEILTDLFDRNYHDKPWVNLLKGDGAETLKEPYVTCLFGSSPAHFYNSIPQHNIEGGYIARNLMIYEEQRARDLDLLDSEDDESKDDWFTSVAMKKYLPHLIKIASNKARLIPCEDSRLYFNKWRKEWRASQKIYNDRTGFINRVPDHVMKVAMCLCLSRYENNGTILLEDFREAIEKVTALVYASQKTSEATGLDPQAQIVKKVIDFLISAPDNKLLRQELLIQGYGNYDNVMLDKVVDTLIEMKWVTRERYNAGPATDWIISLSGEPLERYKKFKEARQRR